MEEQFKKIHTNADESDVKEKHVPVIKVSDDSIEVKVGSIEHPSEPGHFIQWIELIDRDISIEKVYLSPFSKPIVTFNVKEKPENLKVRIFCNLHGTWQSD
jgi:superoxide reductase